jgi:hypothetical protein
MSARAIDDANVITKLVTSVVLRGVNFKLNLIGVTIEPLPISAS